MRMGVADWAHAARCAPGQITTGDRHLVCEVEDGVLIVAIDGLGHGPEAARAAETAVAALAQPLAGESLSHLMQRCHMALEGTRGATVSLARFHAGEARLSWLAVGNVHGHVVRRTSAQGRRDEDLVLLPGLVGKQLPRLRESVLPMARGDLLVLMTDGVDPRAAEQLDTRAPPSETADTILQQGVYGHDDALVVVARYMG